MFPTATAISYLTSENCLMVSPFSINSFYFTKVHRTKVCGQIGQHQLSVLQQPRILKLEDLAEGTNGQGKVPEKTNGN